MLSLINGVMLHRRCWAQRSIGTASILLISACVAIDGPETAAENVGKKSSAIVSPNWGLLANSGFATNPMKAVYFFSGNMPAETNLHTVHSSDPSNDYWWTTTKSSQAPQIQKIKDVGFNVIAAPYFGNGPTIADFQTVHRRRTSI